MDIDMKHIAKLARLNISEDELPQFQKEMESIVNMVEKLPDIPMADFKALDPDHAMILREDVAVTNKFTRDELLKNAPAVQAGCLVVPKTVE